MSWIKIECTLISKPEVMALAEKFGISEYEVAGHLIAFWCWVDANMSIESPDTIGTKSGLDRVCGRVGMVDALIEVGWLRYNGKTFSVPNLDRHLSKGAKQRALDARNKADKRKSPVPVPSVSDSCPDANRTTAGPDKIREEEKTLPVSSLQTQNTPQQTSEPPFKLLSCNRSEWAEIGEVAIPPSLSVFQNEVFAWARHLRSMRGPNYDPNELETHMRDAVRLGRKFPGACEWAIKTRKEKLPNPKHDPDEKIDFEMWHAMRLAFDEGGKVPTVIGEKIGETALEAWVKLARQTLKGKFDDGEARAGYGAEFLGSIGTELPNKYFQILKEVCCG